MKELTYTINDPNGLHVRTAAALIRELRQYADTAVTLTRGGKSVNALELMAVLGMGIHRGDVITLTVEGGHEDEAAEKLDKFYRTYF